MPPHFGYEVKDQDIEEGVIKAIKVCAWTTIFLKGEQQMSSLLSVCGSQENQANSAVLLDVMFNIFLRYIRLSP